MKNKYFKKILAALSVVLILLTIGTFTANKANADTPFPSGAITATYNSATGQLNASGDYAWNLCNASNKKKWVGFALFINGAFPSSSAPDSRALDGTGMHLANGGNPCTTDPGSWSDSHILTSAPTSVCVVVYDVEINTGAPNVGDRSETGAGKDFNEDNSYHNNGDSYAAGDCTAPTVITPTPTPTPTSTPSGGGGGGGVGGPGDGLGCASRDCSGGSTAPKKEVLGVSTVQKRGEVLGASTFAKTGTFDSTVATLEQMFGIFISSIGMLVYGKRKKSQKRK